MSQYSTKPVHLFDFDTKAIKRLPNEQLRHIIQQALELQKADRKQSQLLYYKPASAQAIEFHKSSARTRGLGGGNRSSKTESCMAEICAMMTGIIPESIAEHVKPRFRGPINVRICMESHTTVLHPIMLPKLQWWKWTGIDQPGGDRGHWGWIPKICLFDGVWDKSWSEKLRVLNVLCRDPDNPDKVLGESQLQFMSYDQDPSDFASGTFHIVMHDEPPPYPIWRENQSRTLDVNGQILLAMTWPDDPAIAVDWIFDEVYDKGKPGPNKDPTIDWFDLYTTDNVHLDKSAVLAKSEAWTDEQKRVRLFGQPIRFSNRIHPLFSDANQTWCFHCGKTILAVKGRCPSCSGEDIIDFNHVKEFETSHNWPTLFILDPHPRKPHMFLWAQVDPSDDIWVVSEGQMDADPADFAQTVTNMESSLGLNVVTRLMDPNMGRSPASAKRNITWQDEFAEAQLFCDLADDSDVGRGRVNEYLKPDQFRLMPRLHIHTRCQVTAYQLKRYSWDEHKLRVDRDVKQKPRNKYDDFPTMLKYLLNYEPRFSWLYHGAPVIQRSGKRKGAY